MTLSEICVRRPVFATMLVSACVAIGILSFGDLGVDQFPDVEIPVATVTTALPGGAPEEVETQVTKPIEDAVSTIEGIDELSSTTAEGLSRVTIRFVLDRDRDQAIQDVRDKVATVLRQLPEGTQPPVVTRFDTTAVPVLTLVVSSGRPLRETTEIARNDVLEPLQGVQGVALISVSGGRTRAFQIELDAEALAARGLSIGQVRSAIQQQNVELPGGRIGDASREEGVRTVARVNDVEELAQLVVQESPDAPVLLGDVARIRDSEEDPRSLSRLDGRNAVALVVQKQAGTNTVEVVDALMARIGELHETLPDDIRIDVIRDQSTFIRRSIHEVEIHLVLGGLLASLAVLLFMGSLRSTFIAAISIPASIITTFAILRALDYTLNNFTLLALTLSVGIVIDDAIVVLENIWRHVEKGHESPIEASIRGTKEITLAVMATTLSLIIIFVPTAFMEGRVGRFWRSFGVTTAFAIAISLFVALTLTPMLCSRLLKPHRGKPNVLIRAVDAFNRFLERIYGAVVGWSLRWRWVVVLIAIGTVASIYPLANEVGKDFIPLDDTSEFQVNLTMPEGSTLTASSDLAAEVEGVVRELRGVEHIFTTIGSSRGGDDVTDVQMHVSIVDLEQRDYSQFDVIADARRALAPYADLRPGVQSVGGGFGGGGRGGAFSFSLRGPELETLDSISQQIMARMRETPGFADVDTSAAVRKPEIRVVVHRRRAADLGVRAGDVASTLRTVLGGEPVSKIRDGDEQYDVWLRLEPEDRASLASIASLPVAGRGGQLVRLDTIASLQRERAPAQIDRLDRVRELEISANPDGIPLGTAVERVQAITRQISMPAGYEVVFRGRAKVMAETITSFLSALLLSFVFMYMVLAAQFESFLHPVTIMLALPLSLPFAIISLLVLNDSLNLYSAFGMFMLFGIVKKNGILQVDYTNTLRKQGLAVREAIIQANQTRLRPILMTTLTLVIGMIPIALGEGPGSATRASLARVIIGGQALSLLITLLIVPVAYSLFDDAAVLLRRVWSKIRRKPAEPTPTPEPTSAE